MSSSPDGQATQVLTRPEVDALARAALSYARQERRRSVARLAEFVSFPSVSADPAHARHLWRCAAWLADHLRWIGLRRVAVVPTARHPVVVAGWGSAPERLTLLIYGHYDVQPPGPRAAWSTPPFEPVVRAGALVGRGASDDKGQLFAHVVALAAYLRTAGRLPVNVRCLFEGEEEIGSPSLRSFLLRHRPLMAAELAVVSDMPIRGAGRPAVTDGMRGQLAIELEARSARHDLHAGIFGGAIPDPVQLLAAAVARLRDASGRVAVPGFYDRVAGRTPAERAAIAQWSPSNAELLRHAGASRGWGEQGYSLAERTTIRPALTVTEFTGGQGGPGPLAAIAARAAARLDIRLVPDQDPREILELLTAHLARVTPPAVTLSQRTLAMSRPVATDTGHPAVAAALSAYRRGFGAEPGHLLLGGSIPAVGLLQDVLGLPVVLMGFALPDDRMHAPDERFCLSGFWAAVKTSIWFLAELTRGVEVPP